MTTMTTLIIPAVILMALAVLMLGIKVLFIKGSHFPSAHIHDNPQIQRKGIECYGHSKNKVFHHKE